jgi:hypothetical protein
MTTAVSQSIPVSVTCVSRPFRASVPRMTDRCLLRTATITGAPPMATPTTRAGLRRSTQPNPERGRPPKRLHRPRSGGQRYGTHPKARTGPPRADIPDRSRETSLPSPLGPGRQAIRDQMREPAASSLPQTTRGYMTRRRLCFQRASDPTLRRKSCRRVTASPSDVTPLEEGATISLYSDDHRTTVTGRRTRGKPRGHR